MKKKIIPILMFIMLLNSFNGIEISLSSHFTNISNIMSLNEYDVVFNSSAAYDHISTQLNFGYRVPGTPSHLDCAIWLESELSLYMDSVFVQNFTIQKTDQPSYNCKNILGKLNTDKKNIVILGAHWDSRNASEKDLIVQNQPIPGANDGGSGVGVLLELARVFSIYKNKLDCQLWILLIDAEDQGLSRGYYGIQDWNWIEGSTEFVKEIDNFYNPQKENFECFILLDMVGGTDLEFVKETRSNEGLFESIFGIGRRLGFNSSFPENPYLMSITDDHLPFYEAGIPVIDMIIDFISGPWTYHHTLSDDLSNIDESSLNITGLTVETFIKEYYTEGLNNNWKRTELSTGFYIVLSLAIGVVTVFSIQSIVKKIKTKNNS